MSPYASHFHDDLVDVVTAATYGFMGRHTLSNIQSAARRLVVLLLVYCASIKTIEWSETRRTVTLQQLPGAFNMKDIAKGAFTRLPVSRLWDAQSNVSDRLEEAHRKLFAERKRTAQNKLLLVSSSSALSDLSWGAAVAVAEVGIPLVHAALASYPKSEIHEDLDPKYQMALKLAEHVRKELRTIGTQRIGNAAANLLTARDPQGMLHASKVMDAVSTISINSSSSSSGIPTVEDVSVTFSASLHSSMLPDPVAARTHFVTLVGEALHQAFDQRLPSYLDPSLTARTVVEAVIQQAIRAAARR